MPENDARSVAWSLAPSLALRLISFEKDRKPGLEFAYGVKLQRQSRYAKTGGCLHATVNGLLPTKPVNCLLRWVGFHCFGQCGALCENITMMTIICTERLSDNFKLFHFSCASRCFCQSPACVLTQTDFKDCRLCGFCHFSVAI